MGAQCWATGSVTKGTTLSREFSNEQIEAKLIFILFPLCHCDKGFQIAPPTGSFLPMKRRKIEGLAQYPSVVSWHRECPVPPSHPSSPRLHFRSPQFPAIFQKPPSFPHNGLLWLRGMCLFVGVPHRWEWSGPAKFGLEDKNTE